MILGIGIDVIGIERFKQSLSRTPSLRSRLFTSVEADLPPDSLAARFAAKEALAKALGAPPGLNWHEAEVLSAASGQPSFELCGSVQRRADELGVTDVHLSIAHDAGVATAIVILSGEPPGLQ